jgi:putative oxidoreductase
VSRGYGSGRHDWALPPTRLVEPDEGPVRHPLRWHAGADLGVLVLRAVLAGAFLGHGAQVMFGVFGGPGLAGFAQFLTVHGFGRAAVLAGLVAVVELGGAVLVLFGLFTQAAAAALLAIMINAVWLRLDTGFFPQPNGAGYELELLLAGMCAALILTGSGRIALDRMFPRLTRPHLTGPPFLLLGVVAAVLIRLLAHG